MPNELQAAPANPLAAVLADPKRLAEIDVSKLERLFELEVQFRDREAKRLYASAFNALQSELQPIVKRGKNTHLGSMYARAHDIDMVLQPLVAKHGFSLSFSTEEASKPDLIRYVMLVRHNSGHEERHWMEAINDADSGSKGGNKTRLHGLASSTTFVKRQLKSAVFDLDLVDDDDGNAGAGIGPSAETITAQEAADIEALIDESGADKGRFLKFFGCDKVSDLPASRRREAIAKLEQRRARA